MTQVISAYTKEEIKEKKEKILLYIVGVFFVIAQIVILSALIIDPETRPLLFWLCNNFCFLLAIACFRNNMQMVKGISYVGLIPQLLWITDFLTHFFGFDFLNTADYIFSEGFTYANKISVVLHMVIPILVVLISFRVIPKLSSLLYSFGYIAFLYIATIAGTTVSRDINCIFNACNQNFNLPYNILLWPVYVVIVSLLGYITHFILYYIYKEISNIKTRV